MKSILQFLKSALIGGLLVMLPVVLVIFLIDEAFDLVMVIVEPLTESLPVDEIGGIGVAAFCAIAILLCTCLFIGVAVRTRFGSRLQDQIETRLLDRLPAYRMMKTLSRQLAGSAGEGDTYFSPAILLLPEESRQLVYLIEDHGNGFSTVMIPIAPSASSGPVQYVRTERIQRIQAPLGRVMQCLQECGLGGGDLFDPFQRDKST